MRCHRARVHRKGRRNICFWGYWVAVVALSTLNGSGATQPIQDITCSASQYELRAPTATSERVCASHTTCNDSSDRISTPCKGRRDARSD